MRLLLDTHTFLWWLADDPLLPEAARQAIGDRRSVVHVSAASLWEISVKQSLGRVEIGDDIDLIEEIEANGFVELPISAAHIRAANELSPWHGDRFELVLVAQARSEGLVLVTNNPELSEYGAPLL